MPRLLLNSKFLLNVTSAGEVLSLGECLVFCRIPQLCDCHFRWGSPESRWMLRLLQNTSAMWLPLPLGKPWVQVNASSSTEYLSYVTATSAGEALRPGECLVFYRIPQLCDCHFRWGSPESRWMPRLLQNTSAMWLPLSLGKPWVQVNASSSTEYLSYVTATSAGEALRPGKCLVFCRIPQLCDCHFRWESPESTFPFLVLKAKYIFLVLKVSYINIRTTSLRNVHSLKFSKSLIYILVVMIVHIFLRFLLLKLLHTLYQYRFTVWVAH